MPIFFLFFFFFFVIIYLFMSSFTLSGTSFDLVSSLARAYCFSSLRLAKECYEANHHHTIIDRFI